MAEALFQVFEGLRYRGLYQSRQRMTALPGVTNLIMVGRHAAA